MNAILGNTQYMKVLYVGDHEAVLSMINHIMAVIEGNPTCKFV